MTPSGPSSAPGQAIYTKRNLALYDLVVLRISNRLIWRCPTSHLVAHYDRHVSCNHLDVGVGTGYYLDKCRFPDDAPRLMLFDLNANSLAHAAQRVQRYRPQTRQIDVLEPAPEDVPAFDSIAINYLLHCLPGPLSHKIRAFDHLSELLAPGGVIFGATIVADGDRSPLATRLMALYNRKGIFDNAQDTREGLESALAQRFRRIELDITGCVARFAVRDPVARATASPSPAR